MIELIESSSCERQRYSIGLFNAVTFTSFSAIPLDFCGNSSPASIDQSVKDGEARQRESVDAIKAWWAAHKNESSEMWLTASLRRRIRERTVSLKDRVVTDVDDKYQQWQKNYAIRAYYEPHGDIWQSSVFAMLVDEFDDAPG